ncbi:MAG TPA: hypothetical protein VKK79_10550 [Candidatus Lokiarchaeia archaeon]|nr:hypothetical protein [Candidatus Lokiarchaeia archaeon]
MSSIYFDCIICIGTVAFVKNVMLLSTLDIIIKITLAVITLEGFKFPINQIFAADQATFAMLEHESVLLKFI